jgi:hypothetical protein
MSCRRRALSAAFVAALALLPSRLFAQAWVPDKGEGAVSLAFQELNVKKHLAGAVRVDAGHINSIVFLTDATYGLTNRIAIDLALPIVSSTYAGTRPHAGTNIDNGKFHTTATDFRFSVRYNVTRKGAVFTPYVGSIVPSHDYAYYGHAAAGERLHEMQVGAFVAKLFTQGVPGLFLSGRVAYGFVEKVLDISHNRSVADLEVGYFFTPAFRAFAMSSGQYTHGGVEFPLGGPSQLPLKYQPVHDIIQHVNSFNMGGGFAYSLSDSVDLFGSFTRLVAGRNGHALNRGVTVGASWSFSRRAKQSVTGSGGGAPASEYARMNTKREGSLGRCICQKSRG